MDFDLVMGYQHPSTTNCRDHGMLTAYLAGQQRLPFIDRDRLNWGLLVQFIPFIPSYFVFG